MKLEKEIRGKLFARFILKKDAVDIQEVIEFLEAHCPPPDIGQLIAREYADTARRYIAAQRDSYGRRRFYSPNRDGFYINVEMAQAPEALAVITEKNKRRAEMIVRGNEKLVKRTKVLTGEVSQQEWEEYLGEKVLTGK